MGKSGRVVATFHHKREPDLDQALLAILDAVDHMGSPARPAPSPAQAPAGERKAS